VSKPQRQHRAEVAVVLSPQTTAQFLNHSAIDQVGSARNRRQEPTPASHCCKLPHLESSLFERGPDQARAKIHLRKWRTAAELLQFGIPVQHRRDPLGSGP
jgi:hypothetical protein